MSAEVAFTKGNLDDYLRMLAKEFRKRNGKICRIGNWKIKNTLSEFRISVSECAEK